MAWVLTCVQGNGIRNSNCCKRGRGGQLHKETPVVCEGDGSTRRSFKFQLLRTRAKGLREELRPSSLNHPSYLYVSGPRRGRRSLPRITSLYLLPQETGQPWQVVVLHYQHELRQKWLWGTSRWITEQRGRTPPFFRCQSRQSVERLSEPGHCIMSIAL
jgi:hypothetical protein